MTKVKARDEAGNPTYIISRESDEERAARKLALAARQARAAEVAASFGWVRKSKVKKFKRFRPL